VNDAADDAADDGITRGNPNRDDGRFGAKRDGR